MVAVSLVKSMNGIDHMSNDSTESNSVKHIIRVCMQKLRQLFADSNQSKSKIFHFGATFTESTFLIRDLMKFISQEMEFDFVCVPINALSESNLLAAKASINVYQNEFQSSTSTNHN